MRGADRQDAELLRSSGAGYPESQPGFPSSADVLESLGVQPPRSRSWPTYTAVIDGLKERSTADQRLVFRWLCGVTGRQLWCPSCQAILDVSRVALWCVDRGSRGGGARSGVWCESCWDRLAREAIPLYWRGFTLTLLGSWFTKSGCLRRKRRSPWVDPRVLRLAKPPRQARPRGSQRLVIPGIDGGERTVYAVLADHGAGLAVCRYWTEGGADRSGPKAWCVVSIRHGIVLTTAPTKRGAIRCARLVADRCGDVFTLSRSRIDYAFAAEPFMAKQVLYLLEQTRRGAR